MGVLIFFGALAPGSVQVGEIQGVDPNVVDSVVTAAKGGGAQLTGVVTFAFGVLAIIGRLMANKNLILPRLNLMVPFVCLASLLFIAGCPHVYMAERHQRLFEQATINITEFDRRCQAGDDLACKYGCARAAKMMSLTVDAMHGRESPADPNE